LVIGNGAVAGGIGMLVTARKWRDGPRPRLAAAGPDSDRGPP
jgi:hypothetical protein